MNTAHTPGPWSYRQGTKTVFRSGSTQRGPRVLLGGKSELVLGEYGCSEALANARLIASAPRLLESLADLLDAVEGVAGLDDYQRAKIQKARDALAGATS